MSECGWLGAREEIKIEEERGDLLFRLFQFLLSADTILGFFYCYIVDHNFYKTI